MKCPVCGHKITSMEMTPSDFEKEANELLRSVPESLRKSIDVAITQALDKKPEKIEVRRCEKCGNFINVRFVYERVSEGKLKRPKPGLEIRELVIKQRIVEVEQRRAF